jgi:hypothetical protein
MPVTPSPETLALAHFKPLAGPDRDRAVEVHFNPASLQYTVANAQDPHRKNASGVQFVSQTTAKLTMDLVFDTTLKGVDVRGITDKMAKLLRPYQDGGGKVPPSVEFAWGLYTFTGIVEQYKETLEFFSAGGVPLRSSINLTLSSSTVVFDSAMNPKAKVDGAVAPEPVVVPSGSAAAGGASPSSLANATGDPRAARAIASLSAPESLRFGGGSAALVVAGSVSLSPPTAFSAGAGLGITATAGEAFAGLHVGASATASRGVSNSQALLPSPGIASGGGFALGGAAQAGAGGSLSADVGASADLNARIGFSD